MPDSNEGALRTVVINLTIQPPRDTVSVVRLGGMEEERRVTFGAHVAKDKDRKDPGYFILEG